MVVSVRFLWFRLRNHTEDKTWVKPETILSLGENENRGSLLTVIASFRKAPLQDSKDFKPQYSETRLNY